MERGGWRDRGGGGGMGDGEGLIENNKKISVNRIDVVITTSMTTLGEKIVGKKIMVKKNVGHFFLPHF